MSELLVNGAGVGGLADAADRLMTKIAADACDNADTVFVGRIKRWSLKSRKLSKKAFFTTNFSESQEAFWLCAALFA